MTDTEINATIAEKIFRWKSTDGKAVRRSASYDGPLLITPTGELDQPPNFCGNADASKMLRDRLAELAEGWMLIKLRNHSIGFAIRLLGATESIGADDEQEFKAVAKCAVLVAERMR